MRRLASPVPLFNADSKYWDSVSRVLKALIPYNSWNIELKLFPDYRRDNRMRLTAQIPYVSESQYADRYLSLLVRMFNEAPDRMIPIGKLLYVTDQRQFIGPKELLDMLFMNIQPFSDVSMFTEPLLKKHFKSLYINNYDEFVPNQYIDQTEIAYLDFKRMVNDLYHNLYAYVRRHYNPHWADCLERKIELQSNVIEALWIYNYRIGRPPQSPINFMNIKMIDDTLFYSDTNVPVNKKEFDMRASSWPLNPTIKNILISMLQNYQSFLYQHRKETNFQNVIVDSSAVEGIVLEASGKTLCISYEKTQNKFKISDVSAGSYFKMNSLSNDDFKKFSQPNKSNIASIKALFHLTNGNTKQLDELARISSYICSTEKRFRGAICLPEKYKDQYWTSLIPILLFQSMPMNHPDIIDLQYYSLKGTIDDLISRKINKDKIICCTDSGKRLSKDQKTRLSKVIRGITITTTDPILRRKKHKNNAQFIVFGTEKTAQKLEEIGVPCFSPSIRPTEEGAFCCSEMWLKVILPLWGILLDEKIELKSKNTSDTVELFLMGCCAISNGKDHVEARTLYNSYQEFCMNHGENKPLLFKDFNAYLEKNKKLKRKQLHKSEHKSPTVFYGIRLLDIGEQQSVKAAKSADDNELLLQFSEYAFRVMSEVYKRFDCFPLEKAIDASSLSIIKNFAGRSTGILP